MTTAFAFIDKIKSDYARPVCRAPNRESDFVEDEAYLAELQAKATEHLRVLRREYRGFPDTGAVFGRAPKSR